jgi:hypothetical protein
MSSMEQPSDVQIALAASLRATGKSWEAIGAAVDRRGETVRRWPEHYPARWNRSYRAATRQHSADAASEARATLRLMLRGKNGKNRLGAASNLLKYHYCELALETKQVPGDLEKCKAEQLEELHTMSDERVHAYIAKFIREQNEIWVSDGEGI